MTRNLKIYLNTVNRFHEADTWKKEEKAVVRMGNAFQRLTEKEIAILDSYYEKKNSKEA